MRDHLAGCATDREPVVVAMVLAASLLSHEHLDGSECSPGPQRPGNAEGRDQRLATQAGRRAQHARELVRAAELRGVAEPIDEDEGASRSQHAHRLAESEERAAPVRAVW